MNWKGIYISLLILLYMLVLVPAGNAQVFKRTAVTSFNVDNGLLQNSVSNIAVDKYGFVWFASGAGLQRYDGSRFETVEPFENGMVEDKLTQLKIVDRKELWISHVKGITVYDPDIHRFNKIYSRPPATRYLHTHALENETSVWYLAFNEALLHFDKKNKVLKERIALPTQLDSKGYPFYCRQVGNKIILIANRCAFALFDTENKKFVHVESSPVFINGFLPLSDRRVLLVKDRYFYNFDVDTKKETATGVHAFFAKSNSEIPLLLMRNGNIIAASDKNIFELDTAALVVKANWTGYNQEHLLKSGYITNTYLDRFNNLWITSNSDGVKKINFNQQPFQYYGTAVRENNFVRSIYVNKEKGLMLAGTYEHGLLLFDTLGNLLHHTPALKGKQQTIVAIEHLTGDKYLLLCMTESSMYVFDSKTKAVTPVYTNTTKGRIPLIMRTSYYGSLHKVDEQTFLFVDHRVLKLTIREGYMADTISVLPYSLYGYGYVLTSRGEHCISNANTLQFLNKDFRSTRCVNISPKFTIRCMAEDNAGNLWLGTETGIYKASANGKVIKKYSKTDGLPDDGIYAIEASGGGVYFSHNKGISFITNDNRFTHYDRHSGLQENEFNSKAKFKTADGRLYFGGINGITAFTPEQLPANKGNLKMYITALSVMGKPWKDTAVWNISKMRVSHNENFLSFHIGVPGAGGSIRYNFEYKMDGVDGSWITTSGIDLIRYVLEPGNYTFRARVSDTSILPADEARIEITVTAPWWQQWWFRVLVAVAIVAFIAYVIYSYSSRKYLKKIKQLELEHQIQSERERISRDLHDNLGAYATAIVNTVDKVIKNPQDNSRLYNLKDNASEIMSNLRDTIWALNKNNISTTRLSDRVKMYLQKMKESYPHLKVDLQENFDATKTLSPQFALNLLRIIQEALHNSIKHSGGDRITVVLHIDKELYVSIKDNGSGFLEERNTSGGNGFANMRTRARESNIELTIRSATTEGTKIELHSSLQ